MWSLLTSTTSFKGQVEHKNEEFKLDYFAISLPDMQIWEDDVRQRNKQNCGT